MEVEIPIHAIQFMAVLSRTGGLMMAWPLFYTNGVPMRVKMGLILILSVLSFAVLPEGTWGKEVFRNVNDMPSMLILLASDMLLGIILSFILRLLIEGLRTGLTLISFDMGYGAAAVFDPQSNEQTQPLTILFANTFILVLLGSNFHLDILRLYFLSWDSMPPGTFPAAVDSHAMITTLGIDLFRQSLQIALPIMAAMFLINLSLGIISRFAEEFEVLMLSFPVRLLTGLALLFTLTPAIILLIQEILGKAEISFSRVLGL